MLISRYKYTEAPDTVASESRDKPHKMVIHQKVGADGVRPPHKRVIHQKSCRGGVTPPAASRIIAIQERIQAMTKVEATAEIFWTAFSVLPREEKQAVIRRILQDDNLRPYLR